MPPVTIFWYDAKLEDQPDFAGAPKDQILGDLPDNRIGNAEGAVQPKEHQIIGDVFTDQFFTPKEMPKDQNQGSDHRDADLTPHQRELQRWMSLIDKGTNGSLFIGDKGMITTGTYGENTRLIPVEKMKDYEFPPEFLPRSPGHYRDWIRSCKGGVPACSNFSVSGPFTEWIALGAIATRLNCKLEWDAEKMKITNNSAANEMLKPVVRKGWRIG
jgi:hypothetical protein